MQVYMRPIPPPDRHVDIEPRKKYAQCTTASAYRDTEKYDSCISHGEDCPVPPQRLVWRCVPRHPHAFELKLSFESCTKCMKGKDYSTASNAANHFKRCHLHPATDAQMTEAELDATPTVPTRRKAAAVAPTPTVLKKLGYLKVFEVKDPDYHADLDEHVPRDALRNNEFQPLVTSPSRDNELYGHNFAQFSHVSRTFEDDGKFANDIIPWLDDYTHLNEHTYYGKFNESYVTIEPNPYPTPVALPMVQSSSGLIAKKNADLPSFCVTDDQSRRGNTQPSESAAARARLLGDPVDVSSYSNTLEAPLRPTDSPHHSSEALSTTPDSASQYHVQRNSFIRRLRHLVKQIASEKASDYSINQESDTDSDNASILSEDPDSHGDDQYDADTPDSDSPGSSGSRGTGEHRPSADITRGSSRQAGGSSRTNISPTNGHEDSGRVQTDTSGTPNNQASGTVIRCPLAAELECAGKDDNMSSLLRELSNNAHNIFYCNTCKSLLSRISPAENATTEDTRRLRRAHNENKGRWVAHMKACHDFHCAMRACAPNPDSDLRHKPNEKCQTKREEEKQADVNYLYRALGIAQQDVQLGFKTDHKGKRKSCVRKAVELATEAAQRNVEAESELRECREENEKLEESNRTHCRRIEKLEADNKELCSILRHALEDLRRDRGAVTEALHDRIKRHAPSVLEKYRIGSEAAVSTASAIQDAPRTPSSLSQESVDSTHQLSSSLAPPAKRRRLDGSTPNGVSNMSSSGPQPGYYTPFNDGVNQGSGPSRPGTSPFVPGHRHDSVALGFEDNMPPHIKAFWQQTPQHLTNFTMHQGTIDPLSTFTKLPFAPTDASSSSQEQPGSPIDFGFDDPNANTFDFPTNTDGFNQLSADRYGQSGSGLPGA